MEKSSATSKISRDIVFDSMEGMSKNYKCDPCWQNESECARANFELKEVKNVEFEVFTKMSLLKLVHPKMKISSCFTLPSKHPRCI